MPKKPTPKPKPNSLKIVPSGSVEIITVVNSCATPKLVEDIGPINHIQLFQRVIAKHSNDKKWQFGDLVGIKILANTKVGAVGQDFIEELCYTLGIPIEFPMNTKKARSTQSPWDIKLFNITFELKTATEDTSSKFQFNHIRYHRKYDAVLCLGISPNEILFNLYSKSDIATGKAGKLVSMEKGGNASYKLTKAKHELFHISLFFEKLSQFVENFS